MRADIHDGPEHTLQAEAGYIDARPLSAGIDENLLQRTAGPYIRVRRPDYSVGPRRNQFSSLDWGFGLDQLFCTQPRQLVVARSSAGWCRPATLLHVLALFPIRGDLLKGCQVRFCVAVMLELLHADRHEGCHDGSLGLLGRKFVSSAAGHPAAPRKPDDHRRGSANGHSLK